MNFTELSKHQPETSVEAANDPNFWGPTKPRGEGAVRPTLSGAEENTIDMAQLLLPAANDSHIARFDNHRWPRGFQLLGIPKEQIDKLLKPRLIESISWALFYQATIPTIAAANVSVYLWGGIAPATLAYAASVFLIARQQRGIECMVHDASHGNWTKNRKLNNKLADLLVAYPSLQSIKEYWRSHKRHHGCFAGLDDPCRRRYYELRSLFADNHIIRLIIHYILGYYKEVARKPITVLRYAAWHGIVYIFPLSFIFGLPVALPIWTLFWLVPQATVLQLIRLVGELEEHDYEIRTTEAEATYSNIGFLHRFLIHPHGDAFHWVHHCLPKLPECRNGVIHRLALKYSEQYRNHKLFRIKVFGGTKK